MQLCIVSLVTLWWHHGGIEDEAMGGRSATLGLRSRDSRLGGSGFSSSKGHRDPDLARWRLPTMMKGDTTVGEKLAIASCMVDDFDIYASLPG
jgi:hypothetical protein